MDYGLDEYDLLDDQPTAFARWTTPALIISLLVHALALYWLSHQQFFQSLVPISKVEAPTFKLVSVALDPRILDPRPTEKRQAAAVPQTVELPKDKPSLGAMAHPNPGRPASPNIDNPLPAPKIKAPTYAETMQDAQNAGIKSIASDIDTIRQSLPTENPGTAGAPLIDFTDNDAGGSPTTQGALAGSAQTGYGDLDKLLAQTGPLADETAIRMDADVLYGFDSADLQTGAAESLEKLGRLIQKNPQFDVMIEGHSDSYGTDEYNQSLSDKRAVTVKDWLVQNMHIDASRIRTRGWGKSKLIVPATEPFDENKEAANRRVEIVLHDRNPPAPR